ncbi:MAG: hypothetical protein IKH45_01145 [Neisseriaceae bacterium]|nr:hypothetical protein [Neisseriaceae bacterium]
MLIEQTISGSLKGLIYLNVKGIATIFPMEKSRNDRFYFSGSVFPAREVLSGSLKLFNRNAYRRYLVG